MSSCFKMFTSPLKKRKGKVTGEGDEFGSDNWGNDNRLWFHDRLLSSVGEVYVAAVQGNMQMEDELLVETLPNGLFVGIYDGHGGHMAAQYVREHLLDELINLIQSAGDHDTPEDLLKRLFRITDENFIEFVRVTRNVVPRMITVGSCCMVGLILNKTVYIANAGDSRVVLGSVEANGMRAEQLSRDDNAALEEVRNELLELHPDDQGIVVERRGAWRVKGVIQVSRAIGDAFLKSTEFAVVDDERYLPVTPVSRAVLTSEPRVTRLDILPTHRFLIFASDGLWSFVTNQQAVDIVTRYPRDGIARRLAIIAMKESAKERKITPNEVLGHPMRREIHDDISVVVVFFDHELLVNSSQPETPIPQKKVRAYHDPEEIAWPAELSECPFMSRA